MRLGVRLRLFLWSFALILVAVAAVQLVLSAELERWLTERVRVDMLVRLRLVERAAATCPAAPGDLAAWDRLADDLGARADGRVTLIGRDGTVLGDSGVPISRLAAVENHGRRPEVLAALAGRLGESSRRSTTVGVRQLYLARPFSSGAAAGVARVAVPLTQVDAALRRLRHMTWVAAGAGLGLAALLSIAAAHLASQGARGLTEIARRMAAGDLDVRTHAGGRDELAELGRTLDRLAESLQTTLAHLRDERDLLSAVLDGMHEGMLLLGPAGTLELVNPALREMLLLDAGAPGRPLLEVVRHADLKDLVDRAFKDGAPVSGEIEIQGLRPRHLLVRASPLARRPGGLLAVLVDLTDLRRLESLRRDFVANVSHELRTPIAAVRTAAETLRTGAMADGDAAGRFIGIVERNAERLEQLVNDLLDLARIESRQYRIQPERVALDGFVAQVLDAHRAPAGARRIVLSAEIAPGTEVVADRRALEQVLSNLVDNAVRYAREGTAVAVRAEADGAAVTIAVEDGGPGIEARHLPRLFERFYRVDPGRSRERGGTGLGLSIVKNLCEAMGASVSVESEMGRGTTFRIRLPAA